MTITLHDQNRTGESVGVETGVHDRAKIVASSGSIWDKTFPFSKENVSSSTSSGHESNPNSTLGSVAGFDVCDSFSFPYMDLTQEDGVRYSFIVIYVMVIVLSLAGNWMVIWTVIRNKHMRTVTNYYIVNLAVSDFLVAFFVMPLKLLEYTAPCTWHIFNEDALCSFMSFVLPVFVFASVLTLVAISMERYYAIVYPLSAMKVHSKSRTKKILACTWIVPIIVASPYLYCKSYPFIIFSRLGSISRQICTDRFDEIDVALYGEEGKDSGRFRKGFFFFLFIAIYLVPLLVILSTCVRIAMRLLKPIVEKQESVQGQRITRKREENKRRVARMIIVVAIAFIVAWSPFYLTTFISQVQTNSFLRRSNYVFVMLAVHLVGFINSCINPFIYNFMSDKFRKSFTQIVLSFCCLCARVPWVRRRFSVRSRDLVNGTSEYDPDYSAVELPKGESHLSSSNRPRGSVSERGKHSMASTPKTSILRMSPLQERMTSCGEELLTAPRRGLEAHKRFVNGNTSSYLGSSATSGLPEKHAGQRAASEVVFSLRGNHVNMETSLDKEFCKDISDFDFDNDLFEPATSRLLHEPTSHAN